MSYERIWRIDLYDNGRAGAARRYKAVITGYGQTVTAHGYAGTDAYLKAEEKLAVKPGFMTDLKAGEDRRPL